MVRSICLACVFFLLLSCYLLPFCFARDTIRTSDGFLREGETIISAGKIFELGFFTLGNGNLRRRYVGIWYYSDPKIIVWVANRKNPLTDTDYAKGVVGIAADDNNLVIIGEHEKQNKNTNPQGWIPFKGMMKLLDSGNLVLTQEDEGSGTITVIWQSFKNNPTDTFLPGMKMDEKLELVSWASPDNPEPGGFRFQQEADQYIIRKDRSTYYWKSGVSGDFISDDILPTISSLLLNTNESNFDPSTLIRNRNYSYNITSSSSSKTNMNMRLVMNSNGTLQYFTRVNVSAQWVLSWLEPQDPCNVFNACGNSASCNSKSNKSMCKCLPGFEPMFPDNWNSGVFFEGCRRTMPICSNKVEKNQIFRSLEVIKVGKADVNFEVNSENECKEVCLKDCNCQAYSFKTTEKSQLRGVTVNQACWIWSDDLNNIQFNSTDGGHEILLRLQPNLGAEAKPPKQDGGLDESNKQSKQSKQWPLAFAVTAATVIALAFIIFYFYTRKATVKKQEDTASDLPLRFYDGQRYVKELIDSEGLNDEDKKGIDLPFFDFESIVAATDNFSEANKLGKGGFGPVYKGNFPGGQEIAVKRLSRVSGEEKILLYEFMPNKSLDSFIFDPNLGEQTEGATNRVVGTYGYMSPEYALDGFFSVKSDVFSFGVVILEIISGKKNTGFYNSQEALSLLGYAWRLWQEDKALDMMDQKLSADTITLNASISDGETIISAGEIFELGFFNPVKGSVRRYLGIWYYKSDPKTVVWVANRDNPLFNTNGVSGIGEDGNLVLFDGNKDSVWSTNLTNLGSSKLMVKLLDSGNLVLGKEDDQDSGSFKFIWESFQNPTDTFLAGMKMNENLILTSWESPFNPADGDFQFQQEDNQYIIKREQSSYYFKSGVSGNFMSDDFLPIVSTLLSNGSSFYPETSIQNRTNMRLVINSNGTLQYFTRLAESAAWNSNWWEPRDRCSVFRTCGDSAICYPNNGLRCRCLPGFEPVSPESWSAGENSEGCRIKMPLCGSKQKALNFLPLEVIKVGKPEKNFKTNSEKQCREVCLKGCSCQAYSFTGNTTCWIWEKLDNIQEGDTDGGREILLRQHNKDAGRFDGTITRIKQWPLVIAVTVFASVTALACSIVYIYTQKRKVEKQDRASDLPLHFYDGQRHVKELINSEGLNDEDKKGIDLPFFDFESILAATDIFSEANKLGKGGFGPVYKGNFPGGQEIAVKRLSRVSGDEKILLYEFMPNKSLDSFIFDPDLSQQTVGTTNRVVGTYGYMSPEYALDGFFSVKSDIFSFGVVILEIISGKKNTGFYNSQEALSLLGYAWRLWQEDKALDMMDQKLSAEDGNLVIFDEHQKLIWKTSLQVWVSFKGTMKLSDSGNLVLT
ncbi:hypothetical protein QYF36_001974 [Acer negundo]|nr:hypothetical protein QYF36_001974 [Acer negundo]